MRRLQPMLFLLLIPLLAFSAHKYYISLTKIDFNQDEKSVQIIMRFFIDDVENTLNDRYHMELQLTTEEENPSSNIFLEKYIRQKFLIDINNEPCHFNYLGKEYDYDVIYFYLEITNIDSINSIKIQNTMLFENFSDQENFIKLNINKKKNTFILSKGNDKEMLNY